MKQFDFTHLFLINSPIFNNATIDLLSYKKINHKHLFVCQFKENFEKIADKTNAIYDPEISNINRLEYYLNNSKYIVIHSLEYSKEALSHLNSNISKKIIWCIWGHDLYRRPKTSNAAKELESKILRWIYWHLLRRKEYKSFLNQIKNFRAIFYGFYQDVNYIKKHYSVEIPFYNAVYPMGYYLEDIGSKPTEGYNPNKKVQILLGHSAFPYLNHIRNLKRLKKYNGEIEIHIPLSYGEPEYRDYVIEMCKNYFDESSIHIYSELVDSKTYIELLSNIDIAIFDFKQQAAFGNIVLLLYLGKKIFLDTSGVMSKGLCAAGLTVFNVKDIGKKDIKELSADFSKEANIEYARSRLDKEKIFNQWKFAFDDILEKDI